MRYPAIESVLFSANRKRFMRKMQPDSLAIFYSNDLIPKEGSVYYPFRQNPGLFYLSGLDQPETVLVLFPDCIKDDFQELVFIKRADVFSQLWEGSSLDKEEARHRSGVHRVYWLDDMPAILHELIIMAKRIYVNTDEDLHLNTTFESKNKREAKVLMQRYPAHKYHRSQPLLKKLMMIKHPIEARMIQEAVNITNKAFHRVMNFVKPGVHEFEVEAEVTHEFITNRANGHAYLPIIASGKRSCILHYTKNNQICQDGDLLLLDIGAEFANYASDITRVIPVNGQFNPRQKAVYQAVLSVLKEAKQMLVPGVHLDDYHREVGKMIESALIDLRLLSRAEINQQNQDYPLYKKYCMHSISHHLGLGVHDLVNHYEPLMAGMVFTCEPGIYIPEEGIGVRIENDILVTDDSPIDLSKNIPVEVEEIEEYMNASILSEP